MPGAHASDFDPAASAADTSSTAYEPPELTGLELSAAGTLELAPLPTEFAPPEDGADIPAAPSEFVPTAELVATAVETPTPSTESAVIVAKTESADEPAVVEPSAEVPAAPELPSAVALPHDDDPAFGDGAEEDEDDDGPVMQSSSDSSAGGLPAADEADVPDAAAPRLTPAITPLRALEAVLFAAHEPLAPARLGAVVGDLDARTVRKMVEQLNLEYQASDRAFRIEEIAGGFQVLTKPEYNTWLKKLFKSRSEGKLSQTAMLTLAIVAYKQPIKRVDIEGIRGAACGEVLRALMDKGLVKITGREESLGRPLLYGTTKKFLQLFGLASLKELPKAEELAKP